ncbi:MAG: hypothetical protein WC340_05680 [Kiritimatiellia bacterium]
MSLLTPSIILRIARTEKGAYLQMTMTVRGFFYNWRRSQYSVESDFAFRKKQEVQITIFISCYVEALKVVFKTTTNSRFSEVKMQKYGITRVFSFLEERESSTAVSAVIYMPNTGEMPVLLFYNFQCNFSITHFEAAFRPRASQLRRTRKGWTTNLT